MSSSRVLEYTVGLEDNSREFSAVYMDMRNLRGILEHNPDLADMRVIEAVANVVMEKRYSDQRMSRLMYRECSRTLSAVGFGCSDRNISSRSICLLIGAASSCGGPASIEASSGLGTMVFNVGLRQLPPDFDGECPAIDYQDLIQSSGVAEFIGFTGRSAVFTTYNTDQLFVIKFARNGEDPASLHLEGEWMDLAHIFAVDPAVRFDCPTPVRMAARVLFKITGEDVRNLRGFPENLDENCYAMAYHAHREYFCYPNDSRVGCQLPFDAFMEVMRRNSFLLGKMSGEGILHEAPIPLFHNRVQAMRRNDAGVYQWHLFGRLDRWLDSCEFPNFGVSGLRDFEHLKLMKPGKESFYYCVGSHFLSILLVVGSWFRAKNVKLRGIDEYGDPVDARSLFDEDQFVKILSECFESYYYGFCGKTFSSEIDLHIPKLVKRMIDEMGVDRHMHEFMRVADQDMLSDEEFHKYLISCGMEEIQALAVKKGASDVRLVTGPHLGDFNRSISLPEIVEWSAMAAGCCIASKSLGDRWGDLVVN